MNTIKQNQLFSLLRSVFYDRSKESPFELRSTIKPDSWPAIYRLAAEQGVLAVVWDGVQRLIKNKEIIQNQKEAFGKSKEEDRRQMPLDPDSERLAIEQGLSADHSKNMVPDQLPDRKLKLQWAFGVEQIEKRYRMQEARARELAEAFDKRGIRLHVLKGLAISGYYPHPEHRECGDLDCFLTLDPAKSHLHPEGAYEAGNRAAEELGAEVERDYYKHSHIRFKGLMVENHQFCTAIRGRKERKAFEKHLQGLISRSEPHYIDGSKLIRPSADFNALFLTVHGFQHFLSEGIKLRHVLDWALLLKAEQEHIDWKEFYAWCDRMHFTRFVHAITAIAVEEMGLEITRPEITTTSPYKERVLDDILYYGRSIFNTKGTALQKRLMLVRSKWKSRWKFREIYGRSALGEILRAGWGFFTERTPKLDE